jgi:hypothetical protein
MLGQPKHCEYDSVTEPGTDGDELVRIARELDEDFAEWRRSLSYSEVAELRLYQRTGYLTTNPILRDEVSTADYDEGALSRIEMSIDAIDTAIAKGKLHSGLKVYRGLRDPQAVFGVADLAALNGQVINEPAFVSTSLDREVALRMTVTSPSPVLAQLHLDAGQAAAWLALAGDRHRRSEYEILLPRRLRIKIQGVDMHASIPSIQGSVVS